MQRNLSQNSEFGRNSLATLWRTVIRDQQRTFKVKVKQLRTATVRKKKKKNKVSRGQFSQVNPVATHPISKPTSHLIPL